jgi:hypothetical protein
MNIFYLDNDVKTCAQYHNDKHCVKMILEYCQLLSTAHRVLDGVEMQIVSKTGRKMKCWSLLDDREYILYKATHMNHPSAVWVRQSANNYTWLSFLLSELCREYTYRYGKVHKCEATGLVNALFQCPKNIPVKHFTQPTPAMPDDCKINGDSIASYRNYYINNKTHLASWKNRNIPEWYKNAHIHVS